MKKIILLLSFLISFICVFSQTVITSFNINPDSSYQVVTRTTFANGSYTEVATVPIPAEKFADYLFNKAIKTQDLIMSSQIKFASDSIKLADIDVLLKEKTGKGYEENLEEFIYEEFQGEWVFLENNKKINWVFKNKLFRYKDNNFRIRVKNKNQFILVDYEGINLEFSKISNLWIAKNDDNEYILKKN